MFNSSLAAQGAEFKPTGNSATIAGQGTVREAAAAYFPAKFQERRIDPKTQSLKDCRSGRWFATNSPDGRKMCVITHAPTGIQMSILSAKNDDTIEVGDRLDGDLMLIQNAETGAFFTSNGGGGSDPLFD